MSFYHYNPGYALPEYIRAEPPGRGTFTTKWLPRGTISEVIPDYLARPMPARGHSKGAERLGSLSGSVFDSSTLQGNSLCGHSLASDSLGMSKRGAQRRCMRGGRVFLLEPMGDNGTDPVAEYGRKAARWIMSTINRVPQPSRKAALRALLDGVDKNLWPVVDRKGTAYQAQGMTAKSALERALGESMTDGIAKEIVETGQRVMRGEPAAIRKDSLMGLGAYPDACYMAHCRGLEALGWNPISAVAKAAKNVGKAVGGAVAGAARTVASAGNTVVRSAGRAVASGASAVGSGVASAAGGVWDGAKWVGGKVADGAEQAAEWVGDAVEKLGDLACSLANSPIGQVAAGAGAAAVGAPPQAGVAGAQAISAVCASGQPAAPASPAAAPAAASSSLPTWAIPAGIGAAGLIAFLAMRKKR